MTWLLLAQLITVSAPPLPPAQAAAVMARLNSPANVTGISLVPADGPVIVFIRNREWRPTTSLRVSAPRRLDGTWQTMPATVYGSPYPPARSQRHR
jgi:hypothetical protein